MRAHGLTLLEVLLAIGVLTIVLLAFTGLQVSSLRASSQGRFTQAMVREAENFLETLRADPHSIPSRCSENLTLGDTSASCQVSPCSLNGTSLLCGTDVSNPRAYRVTLQVPKDGPRMTLETVVYLP
ncbi:MAG: prepilin [Thermus sp.]|uniref:type IV pilus modification PilV family protein n=1 Tax=Thermus sp. TaxID=275 RepID=UPI003918BA2B